MGNLIFGSPLAMATGLKSVMEMCLGIDGWKADADAAIAIAAPLDPISHVNAIMWKYVSSVPIGAVAAGATALAETADALRLAEQTGDDFILGLARLAHGITQIEHGGPDRDEGLALLNQARDSAQRGRFARVVMPIVEPQIARDRARNGDLDGAIEMARSVLDNDYETCEMTWLWLATTVLVESLLDRSADDDLQKAQAAIDRLAVSSLDPDCLLNALTVLRLRALVARAHGDASAHRELMAPFHARAAAAGFEPLVAGAVEHLHGTAVE